MNIDLFLEKNGIKKVDDECYITEHEHPELHRIIKPYLLKSIHESNALCKYELIFNDKIHKVNIMFCYSFIWGFTYYSLSEFQKAGLRRHFRKYNYNYNISQYAFFQDGIVNGKINSLDELVTKTGYSKLIL
tara:strand:+ start:179 stop:574 length:396 start_codon:yes stop_codon:yes gene_type:complete